MRRRKKVFLVLAIIAASMAGAEIVQVRHRKQRPKKRKSASRIGFRK